MSLRLIAAARAVLAYHKGELGTIVSDSVRCDLLRQLEDATEAAEQEAAAAHQAELDRSAYLMRNVCLARR